MTAVNGYKCDVCDKFYVERKGTMKLTIHDIAAEGEQGFTDICSNQCLYNLAAARLKDIDGVDPVAKKGKGGRRPRYSEETKQLVTMRAQEVGWSAAAAEFGVPVTSTGRWRKEANANG